MSMTIQMKQTKIFEGTKERLFVETLVAAGHTDTYFVGGCVRDHLLSIKTGERHDFKDIDITTSASPEEVKAALREVGSNFDFVGNNYGVLIVDGIEIAQFRSEEYLDNGNGKPKTVASRSLLEDARRRDFTINALYMDLNGTIKDFFSGHEDLFNGVIRAIENPKKRFQEDASRILRMFYLAARFKFSIDERTIQTAVKQKALLDIVPKELKGKILGKVIDCNCSSRYLMLIKRYGLLPELFPVLAHTPALMQNPKYHCHNVFNHIYHVTTMAEHYFPQNKTYALAALLHDNAKGMPGIRGRNSEGEPNDLEHEAAGVKPAKEMLLSLQFGKTLTKDVLFLVKHHGLRLPADARNRSIVKAIRKMAQDSHTKADLERNVENLFNFMRLDAKGFNKSFGEVIEQELLALKPRFAEVMNTHYFYISELPITGKDLLAIGFPQSQLIREVLEELLLLNIRDREEALEIAARRLKKKTTP